MNLKIELTPEEEARLRAAAARNGVRTDECVRQVLTAHLASSEPIARTLELLAQCEAEDAIDDPDEIRRAEEELAELKAGQSRRRQEIAEAIAAQPRGVNRGQALHVSSRRAMRIHWSFLGSPSP
jgi:hypothetical protein